MKEEKRLPLETFNVKLGPGFDPDLLTRVKEVLHGDNLLQMILYAHLLTERALTLKLESLVKRPDMLGKRHLRWSFAHKASLYVALADPQKTTEEKLFGINRLRNKLAHQLIDIEACVEEWLPWHGGGNRPEPQAQVRVAAAILLFELGALQSITRTDI